MTQSATASLVKVVQIAEEMRANEDAILRKNLEANVYYGRARRAGINLENLVARMGVQPIRSHLVTNQGSCTLDTQYDAVAFVPSRKLVREHVYDEELFLNRLAILFESLGGTNTVVTMTTPGTYERAPREVQRAREATVAKLADRYNVAVEFRFAKADLPIITTDVSDASDGIEMDEGTMFFLGARSLEGGSQTRQAILRRAAELILDQHEPTKVVTPAAVGMSLHLAEVAVEKGIPVEMPRMTDSARWSDYNQERMAALEANPLVTVRGDNKWERYRVTSLVSRLAGMARASGATTVVVDDPQGSEARLVRGVNYWDALKQLLGANGESIEARPARPHLTESAAWTPGAPTVASAAAVPAVDGLDLPF